MKRFIFPFLLLAASLSNAQEPPMPRPAPPPLAALLPMRSKTNLVVTLEPMTYTATCPKCERPRAGLMPVSLPPPTPVTEQWISTGYIRWQELWLNCPEHGKFKVRIEHVVLVPMATEDPPDKPTELTGK